MKRLTLLIALLAFTLTAHGQKMFIGADMIHSFDETPSIKFGAEYESSRLFVGYSKYNNRSSFFEFGGGVFTNIKSLQISGDFRAIVGGEKRTSNIDYGIAYSGFLGYNIKNISIGPSVEHIILDKKTIYINPLSVRMSF